MSRHHVFAIRRWGRRGGRPLPRGHTPLQMLHQPSPQRRVYALELGDFRHAVPVASPEPVRGAFRAEPFEMFHSHLEDVGFL